jgi:glycosyltransferase involved in cell wall biosynthesis
MPAFDLVCFSHLRWDFVYQRPQHLLSRCARQHRVFYVEEPIFDAESMYLDTVRRADVTVAVPHLPANIGAGAAEAFQRALLTELLDRFAIEEYVLWYYTPMALPFTRHLQPLATVYDCMDELSAFRGAPPIMQQRERELLARSDLVFTGGQSLYEAKRDRHPRVHALPSSVDVAHFATARTAPSPPTDQALIPGPRLGFFGVIDERLDTALLDGVAALRPDWQIVMVGPVVKIDPAELPSRPNIHYLGAKQYADLPAYIAGWDVAMLPFARNESTRFISPTKTPEYLAAGRPVVSTSIRDVVRPYGERGFVRIADTPADFVAAAEAALIENPEAVRGRADTFLARMSWDRTWSTMSELIGGVLDGRRAVATGAPALRTATSGLVGRASPVRGL